MKARDWGKVPVAGMCSQTTVKQVRCGEKLVQSAVTVLDEYCDVYVHVHTIQQEEIL